MEDPFEAAKIENANRDKLWKQIHMEQELTAAAAQQTAIVAVARLLSHKPELLEAFFLLQRQWNNGIISGAEWCREILVLLGRNPITHPGSPTLSATEMVALREATLELAIVLLAKEEIRPR